MVTGFDLIHNNRPLQKHWIRRIVAYVLDFIIASIPVWLIFVSLRIGFQRDVLWFFPTVGGAVQVFYCALFEYTKRQTIGKMLLGLRVEALKSGLSLHETILRNISKIHGLLVIIDTLVGMATRGDPRQRYLDRVAETTVITSSEPVHVDRYIREHLNILHRNIGAEEPNEEEKMFFICEECGGELEQVKDDVMRCSQCGRIQ